MPETKNQTLLAFSGIQVERLDEDTLIVYLLDKDNKKVLSMEPIKVQVGEYYRVHNTHGAVLVDVFPE